MLDIIFIILFCVMAIHISRSIFREAEIFREFNQSKILTILVFLFPLGPIVMLSCSRLLGLPLQFLVSTAYFVPALLVSRRNNEAFACAGTDRVKKAQKAVSEAFGTALVGLIYIGVVFVISMGAILIAR